MGEFFFKSKAFNEAPFSINFLLISKKPFSADKCNGVFFSLLVIFVSQLALSNISTIFKFPSLQE